MTKTCPHCKETKPINCFSRRSGRGGYRAWCKDCENKKTRAQLAGYRTNEPERIQNYKLKDGYGITLQEWQTLKSDYGQRCAYCNRKIEGLEPDHIIAKSRGGKKGLDNIVPACESCNCSKNGRPLLFWMWRKANA